MLAECSYAPFRRGDSDDLPTLEKMESDDLASAHVMMVSNRDHERHAIVDMNLRTGRFIAVSAVAVALAVGYAFAFSNEITLVEVTDAYRREKQTTLTDTVEYYNAIFGAVMFTAGKAFEIAVETLVLPTIHTYLHNCPLYPGDQPQRVSSTTKNNCIFWGLKAVLVLMNVGTSSLFVSQTRVNDPIFRDPPRRLSEIAEPAPLAHLLGQPAAPFPSLDPTQRHLSSALTPVDVDYTSVSLAFPRHDWSGALADSVLEATPDVSLSLSLAACDQDDCYQQFSQHNVDVYREVIPLVQSGLALWRQDLGLSTAHAHNNSLSELAREISALARKDHVSDASIDSAKLNFKRVSYGNGIEFTSVSVDATRSEAQPQDVVCGTSRCVLETSLEPRPRIVAAPTSKDASLSVFGLSRSANAVESSVKETLTLTMGSLSWSQPLRVSIGSRDELIVPSGAEAARHPQVIAALNSIVFIQGDSEEKTWFPLPGTTKPKTAASRYEPLVDAFVAHFESTAAPIASEGTAVGPVALAYAVRDGIPASTIAISTQRRLAETAGSRATKLVLGVPKTAAMATFTGCGIMALLTMFVIWRPTSRVRLSPDTTPGAQYLQILTDNLYPDIVHKKRLKFADGDRFPFDDYVIDSIVLYRKDDSSQKVYL
ncbi:hypothetical protein ATCC90586_009620 [Pythium insidiosum]|nr:hypothetical protein ATCC90586_009620 [Pythium insidiosum]